MKNNDKSPTHAKGGKRMPPNRMVDIEEDKKNDPTEKNTSGPEP